MNIPAQHLFSHIWKPVPSGHSLHSVCVLLWKSMCLALPWFISNLAGPTWLEIRLLFGGLRKALEIPEQVWSPGPPNRSLEDLWVSASIRPASWGEGPVWAAHAHRARSWGLNRCPQDALDIAPMLSVWPQLSWWGVVCLAPGRWSLRKASSHCVF